LGLWVTGSDRGVIASGVSMWGNLRESVAGYLNYIDMYEVLRTEAMPGAVKVLSE